MDSECHPIRDHETMQIEDIEDILYDSDSDDVSGDVHVPQDLVQDSDDYDDDVVDNMSGVAVIDADAVTDAVADTAAAWISKYTLAPAGTVDDTRKKSAVWEFYGHLCPLTHPKLKHEKVCLKCYKNNKNKAIRMGGKNGQNPTINKLVQHLRQMHVKDGVYAAYLKAVNALSNANLATEKQSQTSMTSFAADNNAIKRDCKKLCAKWIIATRQPLYTCDSKEFKDMVQSISKVNLPCCDRNVMHGSLDE
jgi:hypothetical protein